jgi:protoheme IX farnesyltransferase
MMMLDIEFGTNKETSNVGDFFELLKPRVMSLVVFTGFVSMWIAPGFNNMHPLLAVIAIVSLAIGAGASGAINMWYERDIDSLMKRTRNRPVPTGRIHPDDALGFAIILSALSVMMMGLATNWVAASVLAFASFYYVVIYTMWLKRRTPHNIVIGGAAGAFPPIVGWAAVTGDISLMPILLFAIIFFWTPPHFWALSLFTNEDYKNANIPMMAVIYGETATKIQMLLYTLLLLPLALSPVLLDLAGLKYGIIASVFSLFFIYLSIKVLKSQNIEDAKTMFGYSIFYLFALFLGLIIDAA